jgi:hypothetical protein
MPSTSRRRVVILTLITATGLVAIATAQRAGDDRRLAFQRARNGVVAAGVG